MEHKDYKSAMDGIDASLKAMGLDHIDMMIIHSPQLCIRYDIQLGMIVLPKTANPEHMKSNADVEFVISDEDMEALKNVEHIKDYGEHGFFPVFGGKM